MVRQIQWGILIALLMLSSIGIMAQSPTVVTIAVPAFWEMVFDERVLDDFEAQHSVDVQLVYDAVTPSAPSDVDQDSINSWLESLAQYVRAADVLFVDNDMMSPEATRAGILLDLTPLAQVDARLNSDDFYPTIWESFTWDNGQWALPIAGRSTLVEYIPTAFDSKQLVYPDANWSMAEFANAARTLTEYDEQGNVTLPGMLIGVNERSMLFYSLIEQVFSDGGQPDFPQFSTEMLVPLFETWGELEAEGVIATDPVVYIDRLHEIPLKIGGGGFFAVTVERGDDDNQTEDIDTTGPIFTGEREPTALAPLPNNLGAVTARGFGISSGTPNPQLAYELVRYLSERPEIAGISFGAEAARRTYNVTAVESDDSGVMILEGGGSIRSDADNQLIAQTLEDGISGADLRFGHYLTFVDGKIQQGLDIQTALQTVEGDANQAVSQMMEAGLTIIVDTIEPVVLADGQIALQFGLTSFVQPLPNKELWDSLASDFAANDPDVGLVDINSGFMRPDQMLRNNDCVYMPTTTGLFDLDTSQLLPLDPHLSADLNYDINHLPPNILRQMQFNNMTYGLPMTLQPEVLTYDARSFSNAGIALPTEGWDYNEFVTVLESLDAILDDNTYPLEAISPINTHLLMLITAQGGLLYDNSTDPVTIDFVSPESVSAIMSVLDLAKDDLMKYERLGESGGFDFVAIGGDEFSNIRASNFAGFLAENTRLASYPEGSRYTPVSLSVGAGFIGVDSAYPEACYSWLSYLANHPFAFTDMPALLSMLDDPSAESSMGSDLLAVYRQIAERSSRPNAVNPIVWDPYITLWLNRAFDAYVFDDADLQAELENAQQITQSYIDCISQPLAGDATQDSVFEQIDSCAGQLDTQ